MAIDLRSDSITKPSPVLHEAMFRAEVGDDIYDEDPTINDLQRQGEAIAVFFFEDIKAEAIELIPKQYSQITRRTIKDLKILHDIIIRAIARQSDLIIPEGVTPDSQRQ